MNGGALVYSVEGDAVVAHGRKAGVEAARAGVFSTARRRLHVDPVAVAGRQLKPPLTNVMTAERGGTRWHPQGPQERCGQALELNPGCPLLGEDLGGLVAPVLNIPTPRAEGGLPGAAGRVAGELLHDVLPDVPDNPAVDSSSAGG